MLQHEAEIFSRFKKRCVELADFTGEESSLALSGLAERWARRLPEYLERAEERPVVEPQNPAAEI
jgi:hypothetical protein